MKNLILVGLLFIPASFVGSSAFARCQYWGPPINQYRCLPDRPGEGGKAKKGGETVEKETADGGCTSLDLTVSCAASGSAVDWINTCTLDCGDGIEYQALAVQSQRHSSTLRCQHKEVPPNRSCSVTVGSGFDSKVVGSVTTSGSCRQTLRGTCAW